MFINTTLTPSRLSGKLTAQLVLNCTLCLTATGTEHQRREDEEPARKVYGIMYAYNSAQHVEGSVSLRLKFHRLELGVP